MDNTTKKAAILKTRDDFIIGGGLGATLKSVNVVGAHLTNRFIKTDEFNTVEDKPFYMVTEINIASTLIIAYAAGYDIVINASLVSPTYKESILSVSDMLTAINNDDFSFDLSDMIDNENFTFVMYEQSAVNAIEDISLGELEGYDGCEGLGWVQMDEYETQYAFVHYENILNSRNSDKPMPFGDDVKDEIIKQIKQQATAILSQF